MVCREGVTRLVWNRRLSAFFSLRQLCSSALPKSARLNRSLTKTVAKNIAWQYDIRLARYGPSVLEFIAICVHVEMWKLLQNTLKYAEQFTRISFYARLEHHIFEHADTFKLFLPHKEVWCIIHVHVQICSKRHDLAQNVFKLEKLKTVTREVEELQL